MNKHLKDLAGFLKTLHYSVSRTDRVSRITQQLSLINYLLTVVCMEPSHQQPTSFISPAEADLPTEVILQNSHKSIGKVHLDWSPQPGAYLDLAGSTYAVLERRHRYQLKSGKYRLHNIALYVQERSRPTEQSWVDGRWVIGNADCRYNARSELLRCSVNPMGPCEGCREYEPQN